MSIAPYYCHNANFDDLHLIDIEVNEDVDQLLAKCSNVKVEIQVEIKLKWSWTVSRLMWRNQSPNLVNMKWYLIINSIFK